MSSPEAQAPPITRATPAFARLVLALVAAGFATFALLYCAQPLLPVFATEFGRSPAEASLAISAATGVLAGALLFSGAVAARVDRRRMMVVSLVAAALLTLAAAAAPNWPLILLARALTGLALSGVPAVALTYIGEEVHTDAIGLAVGLHIGGNVFGGMAGRLMTGVMADHFGWRAAVTVVAVLGLISALLLWLFLPPSRRFRPAPALSLVSTIKGLARPFGDAGLPWLFLESFLCMGVFVTVYNYIGFRLLAPPYALSQSAVGLIFTLYLLGIVSSAWVGDLAGRLGRRKVFWAAVATMLAGLMLTALQPLWLVVTGVGLTTCAFFGAHSVASSWVARRAGAFRAQAASIYLVFYYLGASVIGYAGGLAWTARGWSGVTTLLGACLIVALVVAVGLAFLTPLPENQPAGARKSGA